MPSQKVTRGNGLLEKWLAIQRCNIANKLIPSNKRLGRLLDVGCGTHPYFLSHTAFPEKYGIDKMVGIEGVSCAAGNGIFLKHYDIEKENSMPFDEHYFDVITMLAVMEHLAPAQLVDKLTEIRRILKPGGLFIAATPAPWSDRLLKMMAKLHLVSAEEIQEHKAAYSQRALRALLHSAQFDNRSIQCGYFELYLNIWITAVR